MVTINYDQNHTIDGSCGDLYMMNEDWVYVGHDWTKVLPLPLA